MVQGRFKSRTFRRVFRRTPGGKSVLRFVRRKPAKPKCAVTKQILPGVARGFKSMVRKLSKTERRPNRPYGGNLSSSAMRRKIIEQVRK